MKSTKGKLYGIGVGVGDPENITLKAIKVLRDIDVIVLPEAKTGEGSVAFDIVKEYVKENVDKIFDDFYRENSARGGFGLGLKIVKEICDKNLVIIDILSDAKETKLIYRFKINEDTTS